MDVRPKVNNDLTLQMTYQVVLFVLRTVVCRDDLGETHINADYYHNLDKSSHAFGLSAIIGISGTYQVLALYLH